MQNKIIGKSWEAIREDDSVIFVCKVCGYTIRSHVKNYDLAYLRMLEHIADNHVNA
jgi:hypothetical protein